MIEHLTDADLLARIRAKLASGELPWQRPNDTFGGPSTGQQCAGCDERIAVGNPEVDADAADGKRRFFHARCFTLLAMERTRRQN